MDLLSRLKEPQLDEMLTDLPLGDTPQHNTTQLPLTLSLYIYIYVSLSLSASITLSSVNVNVCVSLLWLSCYGCECIHVMLCDVNVCACVCVSVCLSLCVSVYLCVCVNIYLTHPLCVLSLFVLP